MTITGIEMIIFDLDKTLVNRWGDMYDGVYDMLDDLKKKGIRLVVASYNKNGEKVLKYNGIDHFFETVRCQDWQIDGIDDKKKMLGEILETSNLPSENILFVDDQEKNLDTATKLGMKIHLVNECIGVVYNQLCL